jgi:hypothetical protein
MVLDRQRSRRKTIYGSGRKEKVMKEVTNACNVCGTDYADIITPLDGV